VEAGYMKLDIIKPGIIDYKTAYEIQKNIRDDVINKKRNDTLILLQHNPVITLGTRGKTENLLADKKSLQKEGIDVIRTDRGGDITYHGPGQIVGYPILDLNKHKKDIRLYVQKLENIFIKLLSDLYKIDAHMEDGKYAGVWIGKEKITAVGISVRKWVTMHGFAFNVKTNLDHFGYINPCGLDGRSVTSLEKIIKKEISIDTMMTTLTEYFIKIFGYDDFEEVTYE
jgi:lipoyl(octanoyl) transferase